MGWIALVPPRLGTQDATGMCLRFAQSFFGAPVAHPSAWVAWQHQQHRHGPAESLPPVPVLLWFEHWGTYGSPPTYGNWGHVAIHVPGDAIYTSPASGWGQGRYANIQQIEQVFNCRYVGWSEDINGLRVAEPITAPAPAPEKADDDMARILNMRTTTDHTKSGATQPNRYIDVPGVGIKHIANETHLALLQRYLTDKAGDQMYPAELAVVNSYLAPAVQVLSAETVEAAVTKAIKAAGGSVEAAQVAKAVEAVLQDDFAAIPAAVASEQAKRLQS